MSTQKPSIPYVVLAILLSSFALSCIPGSDVTEPLLSWNAAKMSTMQAFGGLLKVRVWFHLEILRHEPELHLQRA